jgi:hypothetical protein
MCGMKEAVDKLFVVKRGARLEVLFYCPHCEAVNEIGPGFELERLLCRECHTSLDAVHATVDVLNPPREEW